jgi:hypothetical protein
VREVSLCSVSPLLQVFREAHANNETSLDYLFQLAVEMKQLNLPWITDIEPVVPRRS